jgi:hypothetical protein
VPGVWGHIVLAGFLIERMSRRRDGGTGVLGLERPLNSGPLGRLGRLGHNTRVAAVAAVGRHTKGDVFAFNRDDDLLVFYNYHFFLFVTAETTKHLLYLILKRKKFSVDHM